MLIDLHAHSTASDGTDSPAELMAAAAAAGLTAVAITDHDNTGGWQPALAARPDDLWVIRGAEFSTVATTESWPVSVHLLGYLFDPDHPAIRAEQARLRGERLQRGMAIVQKMVDDGVPISAEQVMAFADGAPVGRPHIGRALVESGVVTSVDEAFKTYLAGPGKYYVRKADTDLPTAIEMIGAAGGVSVIAHPRGPRRVPGADQRLHQAVGRAWTRRPGGRPPRSHRVRTRRTSLDRRATRPADHRIVGLPRAQQGAAARPGIDRSRRAAQIGGRHQRGHRTGWARRHALVTAGRLPVGVRVLDLLAGLLAAGMLLLGVLLLWPRCSRRPSWRQPDWVTPKVRAGSGW